MALRAVQERQMKKLEPLVENDRAHFQGNPPMCEDIMELHRLGAIPRYRGSTPDFRVRGLPRNLSEQEFILNKLRNYIVEEKMFICSGDGLVGEERFFCSPSTTVAKKLPDRTISADKRPIWDGRRVNLKCPKTD